MKNKEELYNDSPICEPDFLDKLESKLFKIVIPAVIVMLILQIIRSIV